MKTRFLLVAAACVATLSLGACRSGPAVSDEVPGCGAKPADASTTEAAGELAAAQHPVATGPEAGTSQGRRGFAVSPSVSINRGQGDATSVATSNDASATVSAGAPAVVQTLLGSQANALLGLDGGDRGPVFRAYLDGLAIVRAQQAATTDVAERQRLEGREKELLAALERLESDRSKTAAALAPQFPALTTVVFTNASGSSAGSDKPAVDPTNGKSIAEGVPATVRAAKEKAGAEAPTPATPSK